MNYDEAIAYIESLSPTMFNPSMERFALFMQEQGNPQDKYSCMHIAGTNGKGSTTCMVESVLRQAGLKVGRYIGPHILCWNERFCINGQSINNEEFASWIDKICKLSNDFAKRYPQYGCLTWFECLTAMAFLYFAENKVDCAVIEVGLGGRWDATNVIHRPCVTAVVSIDFDHTHILGNSLEQIAYEKGSIAKDRVPMVTLCQKVALEEIKKICLQKNSPLIQGMLQSANNIAKQETAIVNSNMQELSAILPEALDMYNQSVPRLSLLGDYQKENALAATLILAACEAQGVFKQKLIPHLIDGLAKCFWPGRFQCFPDHNILLDAAHNEHAAVALRQALDGYFSSCIFVLSMYASKNVQGFLARLIKSGDFVFASQVQGSRPIVPASEIAKICKGLGAHAYECVSLSEAFAQASKLANKNKIVVGTGSFATVKAGLLYMGFKTVEESWAHTMQSQKNIIEHVLEYSSS